MSINTSAVTGIEGSTVVEPSQKSMGYGFSLQDVVKFEEAYTQASNKISTAASAQPGDIEAVEKMLSPLSSLNEHSEKLKIEASSAMDGNLKPSELMMLTMRTHEFMFHCELTANVANRSSDGVQQLFRQQS